MIALDKINECLERIEAKQDAQCKQIEEIRIVLGGSSLGEGGLIAQMKSMKVDYYKTKTEVHRLKWFSGVVTAGVSIILSWIGINLKTT